MNSRRQLTDDLGFWEKGAIDRTELEERHPDEPLSGLLDLHARLAALADVPVPPPDWPALEPRLEETDERTPAVLRLPRWIAKPVVAAAAALLLTGALAYATVEPVRQGIDSAWHAITELFGRENGQEPVGQRGPHRGTSGGQEPGGQTTGSEGTTSGADGALPGDVEGPGGPGGHDGAGTAGSGGGSQQEEEGDDPDDEGDDEDDDNSGHGGGDDDEADEDNSGPGGGDDDEADEDNSGPGGGDDDEADDDNSGPGGGDDDLGRRGGPRRLGRPG